MHGATNGPSGDFNGDGDYACTDVDALVVQIVAGSKNPAFDLNGDGAVDVGDLTQWLAEAGAAELGSGAHYLLGDATLDGTVDGSDFVLWNAHKFTVTAAWCSGDFNTDGIVDGNDFLSWNANKFTSADVGGAPSEKRFLDNQHLIFNAAGATSVPNAEFDAVVDRLVCLRSQRTCPSGRVAQGLIDVLIVRHPPSAKDSMAARPAPLRLLRGNAPGGSQFDPHFDSLQGIQPLFW